MSAAAAKLLQSCPTLCDPIDSPWDSPGKNTGVGCHFLLQCMKVKSESEVTQSCPTVRDPMDCSPSGSSVHGIFQARVLEWGAIAFSEQMSICSQKFHLFHGYPGNWKITKSSSGLRHQEGGNPFACREDRSCAQYQP